jgi:transcriptional regulator with XRE-family HTH domain
MSLDLVQLGARIREARRDAGLTQSELGAMLGISAVAVSQVEKGKHAPALAKVVSIAEVLGVSLAMLLGDRLAMAEHIADKIRPEVRALGYDLALIPRPDRRAG